MKVMEIDNQDLWNAFVCEHSSPSVFLQSWEWGAFQESLGKKVWKLGVVDHGSDRSRPVTTEVVKATALVVKQPLPLGRSWLWVVRGPILKSETRNSKLETGKVYSLLLEKIKEIGREEKSVWCRVEPGPLGPPPNPPL